MSNLPRIPSIYRNKITIPMFPLRYVPFETVVDTAFWHGLANRKLNEYCLSEGPFPICAQYCNNLASGLNPRISVDVTSFTDSNVKRNAGPNTFTLHGHMLCYNSLDEFKNADKQALINKFGANTIDQALANNEFLKNPDLLHKMLLITYADLKKHKFYFWFAYPAILHSFQPNIGASKRLDEEFSGDQLNQLLFSYDQWRQDHPTSAVFVVRQTELATSIHSFVEFSPSIAYIGFCDASADVDYPSWLLRNLVYALCTQLDQKQSLAFICLRERFAAGVRQCGHSLVVTLDLEPIDKTSLTSFAGWEKCKGQVRPRVVDLSSSLDPVKLSESAVDLNLKLMKWRLMPNLQLSLFRDTKCLLIGAGTLGCNVARQLMAWGVNTITLVDNGTVSSSNPVRQSLYVFNDWIGLAKPKAAVAAQALAAIYPGARARGVELSIPMPGHHIVSNLPTDGQPNFVDLCKKACDELDNLIGSHDVIFLLTDTRESRWLPTMLANIHGKFVINAALGFDTFLVMRHGVNGPGLSPSNANVNDLTRNLQTLLSNKTTSTTAAASDLAKALKIIDGSTLGCYFCNDVVGPMDSTRNRSLDQQCTVTRPGVSMIASALAVELMISILQHPLGFRAAADTYDNDGCIEGQSSLGLVPHQIRGFLSHYTQVLPATVAFSKCSACSQSVLDAYKATGFDFLLRVFNDAAYLEQICGLCELREEMQNDEIMMLSDSE